MKKNFTKEDIIKKHETNIKSAQSSFALAGILGIIYIVRYFLTDNFEFYFSLSVPEVMLKLSYGGEIGKASAYAVMGVFLAVYLVLAVLNSKNPKWLKLSLGFYALDFICLLAFMFILMSKPVDSDIYIEVIVHFFVIVFLSVGVYSDKKLKEITS